MYPQIFGKYVLERELARGGMARVVLAKLRGANGFEKQLVVKQIRDELAFDDAFIGRFVEEAKTTVALNHPNIVPVYELGVEQGTYFLAMELVEGLSVTELLGAPPPFGGGPLSPEEGAYVGVEVCRALDYAHRRMHMVHRDITPRNVMIDEEGQIKIIDFGIAARAREAGQEAFGTLGHMPPEQMDGLPLSPATDLFAVAVLLMESWGGKSLFRAKTRRECEAKMRGAHPKPSDLDIRLLPLDDVVARALSLDPALRPQTAEELGRALRKFLYALDSSDLARQLGERVRRAREHAREARARSEAEERQAPSSRGGAGGERTGAMRGRDASHEDVGTRTFAVREEVNQWTSYRPPPPAAASSDPAEHVSTPLFPDAAARRPSDASAAAVDISTRKLAMLTPLMSIDVAETRDTLTGAAPAAPRADEAELRERPRDQVSSSAPPAERRAQREETKGPSGAKRGVLLAAVAVASLVGLELWSITRDRPSSVEATPSAARASSVEEPVPAVPEPPAATAVAPVVVAEPPARSGSAGPAGSAAAEPQAQADKPAAAAGADARASFFGDPGTRVFVDGVAKGRCPLRDVALEPGSRDVRFVFEPTGESKTERVAVRGGERLVIRVDFTRATPLVRIDRAR
jgi:serine/threonine-protein kinase